MREPIGKYLVVAGYLGNASYKVNIYEGDYCVFYDARSNNYTYRYHIVQLYDMLRGMAEFRHLKDVELSQAIRKCGPNHHAPWYDEGETTRRLSKKYGIICVFCKRLSFPEEEKWSYESRTVTHALGVYPIYYDCPSYRHPVVCEECTRLTIRKYGHSSEEIRTRIKLEELERRLVGAIRKAVSKKRSA